ncbi:telomere repeats-binding bouquet formation protein 2 [Pelobates fuscus]|uniref:telomere repeats-binding bouquet formation protein 2 n=1 Tax=Pelobates fuscus TaxID=191477 RepID=UPI002FE43504
MFKGRQAWFSDSVPEELCRLWEAEGGVTTTHHRAEYLFSNDASHRDTQRIYNSLDYVENKATIFHASFIQAKTKSKAENLVFLGNFILPPACLQEEIKRTIGSFIWEQCSGSHVEQQNVGTSNGEALCMNEGTLHQLEEYDMRNESSESDSPIPEEGMYYTLQNYPVNNMFTGYVSIDELPAFSEELHDFTPNTSQHFAFCIRDECNAFSVVKKQSKK